MATTVTTRASQFLYTGRQPLDKSHQVQTYNDLKTEISPYVGLMVHVIEEHKIYVCAAINSVDLTDPNHPVYECTWRPVFNETGTEFYLTNENGQNGQPETFKISAYRDGAGVGRLRVTFPGI